MKKITFILSVALLMISAYEGQYLGVSGWFVVCIIYVYELGKKHVINH